MGKLCDCQHEGVLIRLSQVPKCKICQLCLYIIGAVRLENVLYPRNSIPLLWWLYIHLYMAEVQYQTWPIGKSGAVSLKTPNTASPPSCY